MPKSVEKDLKTCYNHRRSLTEKRDKMNKLGVYIHIPFCIRKCLYCDFCSFPDKDGELMRRYVAELCGRIGGSEELRGRRIDTLYFGGGTPTLLPIEFFSEIFSAIERTATIDKGAEVTAECNPATAELEYLVSLRSMGVNRLSIGLQSVHSGELEALGRVHSFEDFKATFSAARAAGFDNISADLMYGIPKQTLRSFEESIRTLAALSPEHISAYGLKVEQGTAFWKMGDKLVLPDEDEECQMYLLMCELLPKLGYDKYEISNFSKKGYESRHNLKYWQGEEYLGFGLAAHSYLNGERFGNSRDMGSFLAGGNIECERYSVSETEAFNEYLMLSMRLTRGIGLREFSARAGKGFYDRFPFAEELLAKGYLTETDGRVAFTHKGALVSNSILSDMMDFD